MRFLVAVPPEVKGESDHDQWAAGGEAVVPWFPATIQHVFLTVPGYKKAPYAKVADAQVDPDTLVDALCQQYPGLPRTLHEAYVLATGRAALKFPIGTKLRIRVMPDEAILYTLLEDEEAADSESVQLSLWKSQPVKGLP